MISIIYFLVLCADIVKLNYIFHGWSATMKMVRKVESRGMDTTRGENVSKFVY